MRRIRGRILTFYVLKGRGDGKLCRKVYYAIISCVSMVVVRGAIESGIFMNWVEMPYNQNTVLMISKGSLIFNNKKRFSNFLRLFI